MAESRIELRSAPLRETLAETAWLSALFCVPLLLDRHADGPFEPVKMRFLQSIAWVLTACLATAAVRALRARPRRRSRQPLLLTAAALLTATALSSALSVDVRMSLLGSFERAQGLAALLAYFVLFLAIRHGVRCHEKARRVVAALAASAALAALLGLSQAAGTDPLGLGSDFGNRVGGTLGNPIFLAAYLAMGALLATALAWTATGPQRLVWAVAAVLEGIALLAAGSRGPTVALLAGLVVLAILGWRLERAGSAARTARAPALRSRLLQLAGAAIVVLMVAALALGPLRASAGRLARFSMGGSVGIRLDGWEAVSRVMLDPATTGDRLGTGLRSARMAIGYGPETLTYPVGARLDDELRHLQTTSQRLDRAHNGSLQQLAETGTLGLFALLALLASLIEAGLAAALGSDRTQQRRATATGLLLAGGTGVLAPWLLSGSLAYSGLGAAAAMLGLFGLGLVRNPVAKLGGQPEERRRRLLVAGILAALIAHIVELQVGFTITATGLTFWALAGLLASPWGRGDTAASNPSTAPWRWAAAVGLASVVIGIADVPSVGVPLATLAAVVADPGRAVLLTSCVLTLAALSFRPGQSVRGSLRSALALPATGLVVAAVALLPYDVAPALRGAEPGRFTLVLALVQPLLVLIATAGMVAIALRVAGGRPATGKRVAVGAVLVACLGASTLRGGIAADFGGVALADTRLGRHAPAHALHRRAVDLAPWVGPRWRALAHDRHLAALADPAHAQDHLQNARAAQQRALELSPLAAEAHDEMARILLALTPWQRDGGSRLVAEALRHVERGLELRPTSRRLAETQRLALGLLAPPVRSR